MAPGTILWSVSSTVIVYYRFLLILIFVLSFGPGFWYLDFGFDILSTFYLPSLNLFLHSPTLSLCFRCAACLPLGMFYGFAEVLCDVVALFYGAFLVTGFVMAGFVVLVLGFVVDTQQGEPFLKWVSVAGEFSVMMLSETLINDDDICFTFVRSLDMTFIVHARRYAGSHVLTSTSCWALT